MEASLLSPLTVNMFLHLSKHKRVLFTSLVEYRVPKKMKDLKSWPVSTNFDLMKRLSLIINFFCQASTTAHPYVTFTSMSLSPSPVVFPGNVTVGIQATVHHHFGSDVKIRVHVDKLLLGQWTNVPCNNNFWSWWETHNGSSWLLYLTFLIKFVTSY